MVATLTRHPEGVNVVIVAESFLPHINGVTHSILRVIRHMQRRGDQVTVIAPASPGHHQDDDALGCDVLRVPAVALPEYPQVRVALCSVGSLRRILRRLAPDVVHLASPFVLGWQALQAAQSLRLPTVSVYQTEVPAYARRYGIPWAEGLMWQHVVRIHQGSTLTVAPSRGCRRHLQSLGIPRVKLWGRGVDTEQFTPARRSAALRAELAPGGEVLVGYVGRLAAEKQIQDLAAIQELPGTRLVLIGAGPEEKALRQVLPRAHCAGLQHGEALGEFMASLDVVVHPGESETFCQTIQEAHAAGRPVVAVGKGGPLELVDAGRNGWLYSPGDLAGMRAAVEHLVNSPGARRSFGEAGREAVAGRSWDAVCNELIGHYAQAIDVAARLENQRGRTQRKSPQHRVTQRRGTQGGPAQRVTASE